MIKHNFMELEIDPENADGTFKKKIELMLKENFDYR